MDKRTRRAVLSALLAVMVVGVHGQPQYRVSVDPPVTVSNIPSGIPEETVFVGLCFREAGSRSEDSSYCPLGQDVQLANGADGPTEELALREGADNLAAAYPTERTNPTTAFQGVGLLMTVTGISANGSVVKLGTGLSLQTSQALGELVTIGPTQLSADGVLLTLQFRVNCVPNFTGLDCTTPVTLTTADGTTADAAEITTSETGEATEITTSETGEATEITTSETGEATPQTSSSQTPPTEGTASTGAEASEDTVSSMGTTRPQTSPGERTTSRSLAECSSSATDLQSLGIGFALGFVTATVIALLVGTIAIICCLLKKRSRQGSGEDADNIELSTNPVYGAAQQVDSKTRAVEHEYSEVEYQ